VPICRARHSAVIFKSVALAIMQTGCGAGAEAEAANAATMKIFWLSAASSDGRLAAPFAELLLLELNVPTVIVQVGLNKPNSRLALRSQLKDWADHARQSGWLAS